MNRDAAFYFANLGTDVSRCITAAREGNNARYEDSLARAYQTLGKLRTAGRPEAYEEGLLMLRGLVLARSSPETLVTFQSSLGSLIAPFAPQTLR